MTVLFTFIGFGFAFTLAVFYEIFDEHKKNNSEEFKKVSESLEQEIILIVILINYFKKNFFLPLVFHSSKIDLSIILLSFPLAFIYGRWVVTSLLVVILFYFLMAERLLLRQKIMLYLKIPFILIFLTGINALVNSPKFIVGVEYFIGTIIIPIMIFVTITNSNITVNDITKYININFFSGVVLGSFSIYVVIVIGKINVRLPSIWEDFNILAAYLMIIFFFLTSFMLHNSKKGKLIYYIFALIPILMGLFFTQTRGVWLSIVIAIIFYFLRRPKVIIPASIFIGSIVIVFFSIVLDRFLSVKNFGSDGSAIGRMQAWLASIVIIKNNWLFGVGFDGFIALRDNIFSFYLVPVLHSHNTYLRLWLELGIFGFIPYIGIMIWAFILTFKLIKIHKKNKDILKIVEALQLSFVGLFVAFMFEPYFSLYGNSTIIIWFLISITYYLHNCTRKDILPI